MHNFAFYFFFKNSPSLEFLCCAPFFMSLLFFASRNYTTKFAAILSVVLTIGLLLS